MTRSRVPFLVIAYAVVAAVMAGPLINYSALQSATYQGDARLIVWTLAWDNHAVLSRLPLFDCNIFYPATHTLAYNEHLFGLSLFTLPLYALTRNPVLAYNIVWWFSFPLNLLAMHALLRRHVHDDVAASAGALVYTFSFYKMLHAHGHLHLVWTWLLPLSLLLLERWVDRPTVARAALWAVAVILQLLTSWYVAVMTVVAHLVVFAWMGRAWMRQECVRRVWQLAIAGLLLAAILWPFAKPYWTLPAAPVNELAKGSADLAAYLVPPQNTWAGRLWLGHVGPSPRWIWGENTLFVGWIALGLAALGAVQLSTLRRWSLLGAYLSLTLVAFALSLGPSRAGTWTPFSVFASLPAMGAFRAPARFALLVLLGLSMLVAFGIQFLQKRPGRARFAVVALLPLMLAEWYVVGFPAGKPQPYPVPSIYLTAPVQTAHALVSLPDYRDARDWFQGADYLYFSTAHWRPIVNGFGRAEPPEQAHVISHMMAFPGPNNARTMRQLGIDYVVFHAARYPDGAAIAEMARRMSEYELVVRIGTDYLFRVRPATGEGPLVP
jgi:hypothetical protein